jgi:uncharacterized protein (DUF58 family)
MARKKTPKDRQCKLTPEGWVYMVIVGFIATGAVLRNVNLLIFATGMLIAPLIFNWRVCMANLRSLRARRVIPERVHALTPVNIAWTCENDGGRLTARNLILHDRIFDSSKRNQPKGFLRRIASKVESMFQVLNFEEDHAHVSFQSVSRLDPNITTYQCMFPGRGKYEIGPAELKTSFPFGLVACRVPLEAKDLILVAPPLGTLQPTWERRIDSREVGEQSRMRRRGLEQDEFYAMRKWRSGDSRRNIHWRSSARMGFPMVKQFDQPNDRDFALLLDLHSDDEITRLQCEVMLSFAATALSQTSSDVRGQLGVALCGKENHLISGRQNVATNHNVMRRLAVVQPTVSPEIEASVIELASQISAGTPLYCFSTRDEPVWLSSNGVVKISPALSAIRHQVRWVRVDSDEFNELFSLDEKLGPIVEKSREVTA